MRNLLVCSALAFTTLAALGLGGCGGASSNHYAGDKMVLFKALADAIQAQTKIVKVDNDALIFETLGRWFTAEGTSANESLDDIRLIPDKSIHISYLVALVADGGAYVIDIKPKLYRMHKGSPQPEPLKEDDISLPGYVHGKLERFAVDLHDAMKPYEAATPAPATPGAPAAAPAPAANTPPPASVPDPTNPVTTPQ
jgi:hypothetical protein